MPRSGRRAAAASHRRLLAVAPCSRSCCPASRLAAGWAARRSWSWSATLVSGQNAAGACGRSRDAAGQRPASAPPHHPQLPTATGRRHSAADQVTQCRWRHLLCLPPNLQRSRRSWAREAMPWCLPPAAAMMASCTPSRCALHRQCIALLQHAHGFFTNQPPSLAASCMRMQLLPPHPSAPPPAKQVADIAALGPLEQADVVNEIRWVLGSSLGLLGAQHCSAHMWPLFRRCWARRRTTTSCFPSFAPFVRQAAGLAGPPQPDHLLRGLLRPRQAVHRAGRLRCGCSFYAPLRLRSSICRSSCHRWFRSRCLGWMTLLRAGAHEPAMCRLKIWSALPPQNPPVGGRSLWAAATCQLSSRSAPTTPCTSPRRRCVWHPGGHCTACCRVRAFDCRPGATAGLRPLVLHSTRCDTSLTPLFNPSTHLLAPPLWQVWSTFLQVALGLQYLHHSHVLHR